MDDLNDLVWGSSPSPAKPQRNASTTIPTLQPMTPTLASTAAPPRFGSPAANSRQNSASNLSSFDPFGSLNLDLRSPPKQNDTAGLSLDEQRRRKLQQQQQQPLQPAFSSGSSSSSSLWGTPTSAAIPPPTTSTNSSMQDLRSRFEPASPGSSATRITPLSPQQTSSSLQRSFAASPQQQSGSILQPVPLYNNNSASATTAIPSNDVFGQLLGSATGGAAWGAGKAAGSASLNSMLSQSTTPLVPSPASRTGSFTLAAPKSSPSTVTGQQWDFDLLTGGTARVKQPSASSTPSVISLDPFDMDPFDAVSLSATMSPGQPITTPTFDDDNPLGVLAEPVRPKPITQPITQPTTPPAIIPTPSTPAPDSGLDHLIAQIVDMGFTPLQARTALAGTSSGKDVVGAIELLIQNRDADDDDADEVPITRARSNSNSNSKGRQSSNANKNRFVGVRGAERERRRMIDEEDEAIIAGQDDGYATPDSEDSDHLERRKGGRRRVPTNDKFDEDEAAAAVVGGGTGGAVGGGAGGGMLSDFALRRNQFIKGFTSTVGVVGETKAQPAANEGLAAEEGSATAATLAATAAAAEARQQAIKQSKEKIVAGATELGGYLYKGASSLLRGGKERIERAMGELQVEGSGGPEAGEAGAVGSGAGGSSGDGSISGGGGSGGGGDSGAAKKKSMWGSSSSSTTTTSGGSGGAAKKKSMWGSSSSGKKDDEEGGVRVTGGYQRYADTSDEDDDDEKGQQKPFWSDDMRGVEELERGVSIKSSKDSKKWTEEEQEAQARQKTKNQEADTPYVSSRRRGAGPPVPSSTTKPQLSSSSSSTTRSTPAPRLQVNASASEFSTSESHRARGNELFKLGQFGDAERAYTLAIDALPSSHDVLVPLYNNRAAARLKTGDHKSCVEDCAAALAIITPDWIAVPESEGGFRDQAVKALLRRASAFETMERYRDAKTDYETLMRLDGGKNRAINDGLTRCNKAIRLVESGAADQTQTQTTQTTPRPRPVASASSTSATSGNLRAPATPNPANNPFSPAFGSDGGSGKVSPGVAQTRAQARQQDEEDTERLRVKDSVDARMVQWKAGKEANLRALIASLESVLWEGANWNGVKMSELIEPKKCKVVYMKAIAKVHPDKLPPNTTVEQRLLANNVFSTLNEAWDSFKAQNGL